MVVVPLTQPDTEAKIQRRSSTSEGTNWARMAAGGGLLAGGLLMLTGNRRAGLTRCAPGGTLSPATLTACSAS
jgi:hypothetical protein